MPMPNRTYSEDPVDEAATAAAQQDDEARRKFWEDKIKKESGRRRLISDLIAKEFRRVNAGMDITDDIKENISRNSRQTHEALYGYCRVVVLGPDRGDGAWTLPGTIHNWDTRRELEVELDRSFIGRLVSLRYTHIAPEHLDIMTSEQNSTGRNAEYTVSFNFKGGKSGEKDFRFQFNLERSYIDELELIRSKSAALQEITEDRDASSNHLNTNQEQEQEQEEERAAILLGDWDRERLALEKKKQQQIESSMEQTSCLHGFSLSQDWSVVEQFLKLFWNEYVKQEGNGLNLEQCIQAAIDVTSTSYGSIWRNSNHIQVAISVLVHNGTHDVLKGDLPNARAIAAIANFFEQWVAMSSQKTQYDWYWPKIHELYNADEHTLVSYFRNRISCTCLDEKHREVRSIKKMGICCNPRCSLLLERSGMESCEQCRLVHYCSRKCQKNDWKRHKQPCLGVAAKNNMLDDAVARFQSAYDDLHKECEGLAAAASKYRKIHQRYEQAEAHALEQVNHMHMIGQASPVSNEETKTITENLEDRVRQLRERMGRNKLEIEEGELAFLESETWRQEAWSELREVKAMLPKVDYW
eukprot:scaffold13397_cov151-Skeletonema_marinoi.AAC.2